MSIHRYYHWKLLHLSNMLPSLCGELMVAVAQLVEPRFVVPVVAGSSPVGRPILPTEVPE